MNNFISLYGEVLDYPQQASIDKKGTEYYKFNLAVQRESGIIDILPIVVEEDTAAYNGYEEGLVNGIALAGQALDTVLKKYEADGALTALAVEEITKAVGQYIAETPGKAKQQLKAETAAAGEDQEKAHE